MGKPAARIGDMTAHGGAITVGFPTVLIGGMPAARLGDMHVCPMVTPGTPPIPHVGGPVNLGSTGVLIGGAPAARIGDMCVCVGPPDTIAGPGCPTVLIGEVGSGSGGGGGGGGAAGKAGKAAKAGIAGAGKEKVLKKPETHWIEYVLKDSAGLPLMGVNYELKTPDGEVHRGTTGPDGRVRKDFIPKGNCELKLLRVDNARWSVAKAKVGDKVKLTADVEGYDPGTPAVFEIYERDSAGPDDLVAFIQAKTQKDKVEVEWEYVYVEEDETNEAVALKKATKGVGSYEYPEYYFVVTVANRARATSETLYYNDEIKFKLLDEKGDPVPNEEYFVYLKNGEVRKGKLDGKGRAHEKAVPPGLYKVVFPKRKGFGPPPSGYTVSNAAWGVSEARRGETVRLFAGVAGAPDGTPGSFTIYEHDYDGNHDFVCSLDAAVQGGKLLAEWEVEYGQDTDDVPAVGENGGQYVWPEFFFRVVVADAEAESGLLKWKDYVQLEVKDDAGRPLAGFGYRLRLADGSERTGQLDEQGQAREEDVPPGPVEVAIDGVGGLSVDGTGKGELD